MKEGTYTGLHVSVRRLKGDEIIENVSASGGRKLDDFIYGSHVNYVGARNIVNGRDDADAIAHQAERYAAALQGRR